MQIRKLPPDFKPQWDEKMSGEMYHELNYLGSSGLLEIKTSPAHFKARVIDGVEKKESKAFREGNLIHAAILEPERFSKLMVVRPKFDMRTNAGKAESKAWDSENEGRISVSESELEMLRGICNSLLKKRTLLAMINAAKKEISGFFRHEATGIALKFRPDAILVDQGLVLDIKSTTDASLKGFDYAIRDYSYYVKAAFYLAGASALLGRPVEHYSWIAVEKAPPYDIAVYNMCPIYAEAGKKEFEELMQKLDRCLEKNEWPGYQGEESEYTSPPEWFTNQVWRAS